jgi:toxin ParE1/3/4
MIHRALVFSPEANADLLSLYDWIANAASPAIALGYIEGLEQYLAGFDVAPERGTRWDDVREGLRIVGFEGRVAIAFTLTADQIAILRIL